MTTIVVDADQIRTIIKEAVEEAVEAKLFPLLRRALLKSWLTKDELKEQTGWSDRTIQDLRDRNRIPFSQHGRKILYPREGIEQFLRAHHIKARAASSAARTPPLSPKPAGEQSPAILPEKPCMMK